MQTKTIMATETQSSGVRELLVTKLDPPRIFSAFPFLSVKSRNVVDL